jgi:hypothetical protein
MSSLRVQRTEMAKYTTFVRATPGQGFRWKVIADGHTLKSGTAPTEMQARTDADEAMRLIQAAEHRQA